MNTCKERRALQKWTSSPWFWMLWYDHW